MNSFFKSAVALIILTRAVAITPAYSQTDLRTSIGKLIATVDGEIGVGVRHLERGDTLSVNGDEHFPMQSVFKFHLALAVLHEVDEGKLSLDQEVFVKKEDFIPNTWSPIAAKHPEGNINLTIRDLISYTVASSDNNGCDVLFGLLGGPDKVNTYIAGLGINDIAIKNTEREMHQSWDLQFKNWTTPTAMANLLDMFYKGHVLAPKTAAFLRTTLEETITGKNRIKGLLPVGTTVAHKTGMGERNGVIGAVNDVGVITLPNGQHVSIALFITKTSESVPALEKLMAEISRRVFDYFSRG
jgi:beta-lactamase class A